MNIPVIRGGAQKMLDSVACAFLFTTREQHVDAIEIGLNRTGIKLERTVKRTSSSEDVYLAPISVADILKVCHADTAPRGSEARVVCDHAFEQRLRRIEIGAAAGARHE